MRRFIVWGIVAIAALSMAGCGDLYRGEDLSRVEMYGTDRLLLLVESGLRPALEGALDRYARDLSSEGCEVRLEEWRGGTARDLRQLLVLHESENGTGGAFLVGNLPAAWYEQDGFRGEEEFPCDLFLMDLDARWNDGDGDGVLDGHSPLDLDIFVSRVDGDLSELDAYFDKVRRYRSGELEVWKGAYVFKDDDWAGYRRGSSFELSSTYSNVEICEDFGETVRENYVKKLAGPGAEYVYQWIHSHPPLLCIEAEPFYEYVGVEDVSSGDYKGMFYNLYNCSASRFTQKNLAMAYLVSTGYGLATIGSTKVGGNYHPQAFHHALSRGARWGDAFRAWYNGYGVTDDRWFLGMVILGDPMLTLSVETRRSLEPPRGDASPPSLEEIGSLEEVLRRFAREDACLGFDEYRADNPRFFE